MIENNMAFFFVPSLQEFLDTDETPTSLLLAEQSQIAQHLLFAEVLHSFDHLGGPLLNSFQQFHFSLELRVPELHKEH